MFTFVLGGMVGCVVGYFANELIKDEIVGIVLKLKAKFGK